MLQLQSVPAKVRLQHKLAPNRFPNMSPLMAAIVGHLVDFVFVQPPIREIVVTSDDFVLARVGEDSGANLFIGSYTQLLENWARLLTSAGLTNAEWIEAEAQFAAKIGYFGRVIA